MTVLFAALLIFFTQALSAQPVPATDLEILRRADSLASYMDADFSAEYTIVQDKPGSSRSTTVVGIFRRDRIETYVMVIMQPAISRGQGYLKQGKTLWFYDPESRRFNTTSSSERFQNTNARNSDFTRSTLADDYRIVGGKDVALGRFKCRLLTLEAITADLSYPRMKIWISDDGLVRQTEDYSLSGQLLRTSAFPDYQKIGNRFVPKMILFEETLKGAMIDGKFVHERTRITINKPSFVPVPDSTYSKTFLESVGK
jgi:outer membrane lipoprotein-sorting protein